MLIKVHLHGVFKDKMPDGHKRPKTFYVNRIKDVFDCPASAPMAQIRG